MAKLNRKPSCANLASSNQSPSGSVLLDKRSTMAASRSQRSHHSCHLRMTHHHTCHHLDETALHCLAVEAQSIVTQPVYTVRSICQHRLAPVHQSEYKDLELYSLVNTFNRQLSPSRSDYSMVCLNSFFEGDLATSRTLCI